MKTRRQMKPESLWAREALDVFQRVEEGLRLFPDSGGRLLFPTFPILPEPDLEPLGQGPCPRDSRPADNRRFVDSSIRRIYSRIRGPGGSTSPARGVPCAWPAANPGPARLPVVPGARAALRWWAARVCGSGAVVAESAARSNPGAGFSPPARSPPARLPPARLPPFSSPAQRCRAWPAAPRGECAP